MYICQWLFFGKVAKIFRKYCLASHMLGIYAVYMHRTMIYIGDEEYRQLLKGAKFSGRKLSELIREAIKYYLHKVVKNPPWEADPVWGLSGMAKSSQTNTDSRDHDEILYGEKS